MLAGKVAVVTGAGSGLGQATAIALAAEGALVFVTELPDRLDRAGETASRIRSEGGTAETVALDVRDLGSISRTVESVIAQAGRLDILVNNAGVNVRKPALEVTEADCRVMLLTSERTSFRFNPLPI